MSSSLCALDRKPASNADGARYTPRSSMPWKKRLNAAVSAAVPIPVIASGGAGTFAHFHDVFTTGRADAALAASVFHFSEHAVADLKAYLHERGVPVRRQAC